MGLNWSFNPEPTATAEQASDEIVYLMQASNHEVVRG
jgi:hypothetical protein